MSDPRTEMRQLEPKKDYLIAIDSDGSAFDTMEIKIKECFIPTMIKHWKLRPISKYARSAYEFVSLYSKWRGVNRFPGLIKTFDLLKEWPDVLKRQVDIPEAEALRDWIKRESRLGHPTLEREINKTKDPVLIQALEWSRAVNDAVKDIVYSVPPFPFVQASLQKISKSADIIVCSVTSNEALVREWEEHGLAQYTRLIAGQEMGLKKEIIHYVSDGKYDKDKVLMIGDAPGDMNAAKANDALFYPIKPGHEEESWEFFYNEAADKFLNDEYTANYEEKLIREYEKLLPEIPPWKK